MDFFSRDVRDSFDRMFDLNRDGKLDAGEQAYQYQFMEEEIESGCELDDDDWDDDFDVDGEDF